MKLSRSNGKRNSRVLAKTSRLALTIGVFALVLFQPFVGRSSHAQPVEDHFIFVVDVSTSMPLGAAHRGAAAQQIVANGKKKIDAEFEEKVRDAIFLSVAGGFNKVNARITLITFGATPKLVHTADLKDLPAKKALLDKIRKLERDVTDNGKRTGIYPAIALAAGKASANHIARGQRSREHIILITDGRDNPPPGIDHLARKDEEGTLVNVNKLNEDMGDAGLVAGETLETYYGYFGEPDANIQAIFVDHFKGQCTKVDDLGVSFITIDTARARGRSVPPDWSLVDLDVIWPEKCDGVVAKFKVQRVEPEPKAGSIDLYRVPIFKGWSAESISLKPDGTELLKVTKKEDGRPGEYNLATFVRRSVFPRRQPIADVALGKNLSNVAFIARSSGVPPGNYVITIGIKIDVPPAKVGQVAPGLVFQNVFDVQLPLSIDAPPEVRLPGVILNMGTTITDIVDSAKSSFGLDPFPPAEKVFSSHKGQDIHAIVTVDPPLQPGITLSVTKRDGQPVKGWEPVGEGRKEWSFSVLTDPLLEEDYDPKEDTITISASAFGKEIETQEYTGKIVFTYPTDQAVKFTPSNAVDFKFDVVKPKREPPIVTVTPDPLDLTAEWKKDRVGKINFKPNAEAEEMAPVKVEGTFSWKGADENWSSEMPSGAVLSATIAGEELPINNGKFTIPDLGKAATVHITAKAFPRPKETKNYTGKIEFVPDKEEVVVGPDPRKKPELNSIQVHLKVVGEKELIIEILGLQVETGPESGTTAVKTIDMGSLIPGPDTGVQHEFLFGVPDVVKRDLPEDAAFSVLLQLPDDAPDGINFQVGATPFVASEENARLLKARLPDLRTNPKVVIRASIPEDTPVSSQLLTAQLRFICESGGETATFSQESVPIQLRIIPIVTVSVCASEDEEEREFRDKPIRSRDLLDAKEAGKELPGVWKKSAISLDFGKVIDNPELTVTLPLGQPLTPVDASGAPLTGDVPMLWLRLAEDPEGKAEEIPLTVPDSKKVDVNLEWIISLPEGFDREKVNNKEYQFDLPIGIPGYRVKSETAGDSGTFGARLPISVVLRFPTWDPEPPEFITLHTRVWPFGIFVPFGNIPREDRNYNIIFTFPLKFEGREDEYVMKPVKVTEEEPRGLQVKHPNTLPPFQPLLGEGDQAQDSSLQALVKEVGGESALELPPYPVSVVRSILKEPVCTWQYRKSDPADGNDGSKWTLVLGVTPKQRNTSDINDPPVAQHFLFVRHLTNSEWAGGSLDSGLIDRLRNQMKAGAEGEGGAFDVLACRQTLGEAWEFRVPPERREGALWGRVPVEIKTPYLVEMIQLENGLEEWRGSCFEKETTEAAVRPGVATMFAVLPPPPPIPYEVDWLWWLVFALVMLLLLLVLLLFIAFIFRHVSSGELKAWLGTLQVTCGQVQFDPGGRTASFVRRVPKSSCYKHCNGKAKMFGRLARLFSVRAQAWTTLRPSVPVVQDGKELVIEEAFGVSRGRQGIEICSSLPMTIGGRQNVDSTMTWYLLDEYFDASVSRSYPLKSENVALKLGSLWRCTLCLQWERWPRQTRADRATPSASQASASAGGPEPTPVSTAPSQPVSAVAQAPQTPPGSDGFGTPSPPSTGSSGFGTPSDPSTGSSGFGSPSDASTGSSGFGSPSDPSTGSSGFGSPSDPSTGGSGSGTPSPPSTGSDGFSTSNDNEDDPWGS